MRPATGNPTGNAADDTADDATVFGLLARAAEVFGRRTAIVDRDRVYTYAQVHQTALDVAAGLQETGVRAGDRVAIWLPNCVEWVSAFFGAVRAGAVVVPLNTGLTAAEADYQIAQSGASVVIAATSYRSRNLASESISMAAGSPTSVTVIAVGTATPHPALPWDRIAGRANASMLKHVPRSSDPVVMLYTSGTTGLPKGAVHTSGFLGSLLTAADRLAMTEDDCIVLYLPLFHVYALMAGLVLMTAVGGKLVLMPQFDSRQSLALMASERATIVYGVPTTYIDQLNDPTFETHDLSSIRLSITPFARELSDRVSARFGRCANCFGMTETASMAFLPELTDPPELALGSAGKPLGGLEARVVDPDDGTPLEAGQAGLLLLRGPLIMREYHDKPAETGDAFTAQGWFRTGDVARLDADGYLSFVGRRGDHFKVGGEYVDPAEVEAALQSHPWVERAAVVGVPDERLGEVGYAWIQLRPTAPRQPAEVYAEELLSHLKGKVAFFKLPRDLFVVEELPTTPSGKVQKFKLAERLSAAAQSR